MVGTVALAPSFILIAALVALALAFVRGDVSQERRKRLAALEQAKANWRNMEATWHHEAGGGSFSMAMEELRRARAQREQLDLEFAKEKQRLISTLRDRQLKSFLANFFLDDHSIPNIGPGRKATLASFGIETAADINRQRILAIKGFGPNLAANLTNWRRSIETRFVFDPAKGIDPQDAAALQQRFNQKRKELEGILLAGPERLERLRAEALKSQERLKSHIHKAAQDFAQATADLTAI